MIRRKGERFKESDHRWSQPRFLERLEGELPVELIEVWNNPPHDAKVVWFALPDPQAPDVIKHYEHWSKFCKGKTINHPALTYMTKRLWYFFLNMNGVRAPHPTKDGWFTKTEFHGYGPKFSCEYIESRNINALYPDNDNPNHKVWRVVVYCGQPAEESAYFEESGYWVQSGGASVRELKPTPTDIAGICRKVAQISKLDYFHIEIIPSPWVGNVVVDVNPHPFDVLEGRLNDTIKERVVSTIKEWLNG